MTKEQLSKSIEIINGLISKHESMRAFARAINEDVSDVIRWKGGRKVKPRAVVSIVQLYDILPYDLRPDLFPKEMRITFNG